MAVTLVFTMAPFGVFADTAAAGSREFTGTVTWDGIAMDSSSLPDYVKYNKSTGTLTIGAGTHSYTLTNSSNLISVSGSLDLTVDIEGDLTVDAGGGEETPKLIENGILSTTVKGAGSIEAGQCDLDTAGGVSISGCSMTARKINGDEGSSINISGGAAVDCSSINTVTSEDSNVRISGGSKVTLTKIKGSTDLNGAITTRVCSITDSDVSVEGGILTVPASGSDHNDIDITMTRSGHTVTSKSAIMAIDEYADEEEETVTGMGRVYLTGCAVSSPVGGKVSFFNGKVDLYGSSTQAKVYAITDQGGSIADDIAIGYSSTYPKTGTTARSNGGRYRVTRSGISGCEVQYTGPVSKKSKTASVNSTVSIGGKTFKVTSIAAKAFYKNIRLKSVTVGSNARIIGKNVFYGDKKLNMIKIKSKMLKSVGKNAIRGIYKKAVIKVPGSKYRAYKKLFTKSTGFRNTMQIKKY